jgi:hypothetical protein
LPTSNYTEDIFGAKAGTIDLAYERNRAVKTVSLEVDQNNIKRVKQ